MSDSIVFAPELEMDVDAFAEFWNESEFAEYGLAMPQGDGQKNFEISTEMAVALVGAASSLSTAILTLAMTEYFKRKAKAAAKLSAQSKPTKVTKTTQKLDADGNRMWVIIEETVTT